MKPTLLVLAAGMGSRYGGLKQVDKLGPQGETIIDYSIYDALHAGFGKVIFVIRKSIEQEFKETFLNKYAGKIAIDYVLQEISMVPADVVVSPDRVKPWGTGHAVLMAEEKIHEPFAVINGDDFYGREAFAVMAKFLNNLPQTSSSVAMAMVGYQLGKTLSENGYVSRGICFTSDKAELTDVKECTHIERKNGQIVSVENDVTRILAPSTTVSMNFWGFTPAIFGHLNKMFSSFAKENANNIKAEFYIPFVVNNLIASGEGSVKVLGSDAEWFGVTYKEDRPFVVRKLQQLVDDKVYPSPLW